MEEYRELPPPPALARYLACTWTRTTGEADSAPPYRILPDGCIDIVCVGDLPPWVAGPDTGPVLARLPSSTAVVGVRFRPGAAPALLGLPSSEILDARVSLEDVWGSDAGRLHERLVRSGSTAERLAILESALSARLPAAEPPDRVVEASVARLARRPAARVSELSDALGISERQLLRRFRAAVGYGPKTLGRVLRLQRTLVLAADGPADRVSLASLAAEAGYADQAHMTREVTRLAGVAPAVLLGRLSPAPPMSDSFKTEPVGA